MKNHGRAAYEAYTREMVAVGWDTLTSEEQAAWHAAGEAAIREFWGPDSCPPTVRAPAGYPGAPS